MHLFHMYHSYHGCLRHTFSHLMANMDQVQTGQKESGHPTQERMSTSSRRQQTTGINLIGGNYKIGRKIGEGSFGIIYEGRKN